MAPVDGGLEASRRMHEYLLSKQRKQEEYWLRKYGKVLQSPPPSVGKIPSNARLPSIAGEDSVPGYGSPAGPSAEPSASSSQLPPIPGARALSSNSLPTHHHRQPKGHAPIFHAKEPVKDFFSRNTRQPRSNATQDGLGNLVSPSHRPPEPYRKVLPGQLPPLEHSYGSPPSQQQQLQSPGAGNQATAATGVSSWQPPQGYTSAQAEAAYMQHQQHLLQQQSLQQQQQQASTSPGQQPQQQLLRGPHMATRLPPLQQEASSSRSVGHSSPHGSSIAKPLRNLEMELTVIRAIKAREDVLERLRIAGGKLDSGFGGSAPVVLSPVDPMVRLFYRLVGSLRQRTLDVIEAISAWRRKVSPTDPFVYFGVDYLAAIGSDISFLDELPFLRTRLTFRRAVDDPFLAEVTPDGIPIEEATTCDLRRGGQRFSSDALRIRMARKVLAQYCGRPLPVASTSTLESGSSGLSAERSAMMQEPTSPLSLFGLPKTVPEVPEEGEDDDTKSAAGQRQPEPEVSSTIEQHSMTQLLKSLSPPVVPQGGVLPPLLRAITPPAAAELAPPAAAGASEPSAMLASTPSRNQDQGDMQEVTEAGADPLEAQGRQEWPDEAAQQQSEEEEDEEDDAQQRELEMDSANEPQPQQAEVIGEAAVVLGASPQQPQQFTEQKQVSLEAVASAQEQPPTHQPQSSQAAEPQPDQLEDLLAFENDDDYIDFALGAIIHSLEPPYVNSIPPGSFTVAGWEIDQQLEEVVRSIASPIRASRTAMKAAAAGAGNSPLRSSLALPTAAGAGNSPLRSSLTLPTAAGAGNSPLRSSLTLPAAGPFASPARASLTPPTRSSATLLPDGSIPSHAHGSLPLPTTGSLASPMRSSSTLPTAASSSSVSSQSAPVIPWPPQPRPPSTGPARIPTPPAGPKPPSRGSGTPSLPSRTSRIPTPPLAPRPGSPSTATVASVGYVAASEPASGSGRPSVRVHLRPGSQGVNLRLSMDADGAPGLWRKSDAGDDRGSARSRGDTSSRGGGVPPAATRDSIVTPPGGATPTPQAPTDAGTHGSGRPSVRVQLRPHSRGVDLRLSIDTEAGIHVVNAVQGDDEGAEGTAAGSTLLALPASMALGDMPQPLQGSLSARGNRASLRSGRTGSSRPGSANPDGDTALV